MIARWIAHLLPVDVEVVPLVEATGVDLTWYVGLDAEATRIGDALWSGEELEAAARERIVALYRLNFRNPEVALETARGAPIYLIMAMAPDRTLRMTQLAYRTNATLPRLSHVVSRLERRGLVERFPCPEDRRATNARLTPTGWDTVVATAPGHVATVRDHVVDALTDAQVVQLGEIAGAILDRVDPEDRMGTRRR